MSKNSINDAFFKCVVATNIIIARKLTENRKKDLTKEFVKGVFLSYISKDLFSKQSKYDYVRFSKDIKILQYSNCLMIAKISFRDDIEYQELSMLYSDSLFIDTLSVAMEYCDYKKAFNFLNDDILKIAYELSTRNTAEVMFKMNNRLINYLDDSSNIIIQPSQEKKPIGFRSNGKKIKNDPVVIEPVIKKDPEDWQLLETINL